jgi:triphosphoribosyl-dephospho-CoA synthase
MMTDINLANAFKAACMAELEALKPGNVHIFADGHGMTVQDFIASADAVSEVITQPDLSLGERILQSVQATHDVVKMNTNLGMILLCAPLIQAKLIKNGTGLQANIHAVLSGHHLTAEQALSDTEACFAAIRLANPAGLGAADTHDVQNLADCTLQVAMQQAASFDSIARQFSNNFADVFDGLAYYQKALTKWQRPAWAATALHLHFMSSFLDSHIARKHNETIAKLVQNQAAEHADELSKSFNPKNYQTELLSFDAALKKQGLNPGTSADLTVASLFLHAIT